MLDRAKSPRQRKLALITDASSSHGAAFARSAALRGLDVALIARNEERLHALAREICTEYSVTTHMFRADPRNMISTADICRWITSRNLSVDVLINNAGCGKANAHSIQTVQPKFDELPLALTAPILLTYHCLPGMLARRWGRIINVRSNLPTTTDAEGVTQRAIDKSVATFYQALNAEIADRGVTVSSVSSEATNIDFGCSIDTGSSRNYFPSTMECSLELVARKQPTMLSTASGTARATSPGGVG